MEGAGRGASLVTRDRQSTEPQMRLQTDQTLHFLTSWAKNRNVHTCLPRASKIATKILLTKHKNHMLYWDGKSLKQYSKNICLIVLTQRHKHTFICYQPLHALMWHNTKYLVCVVSPGMTSVFVLVYLFPWRQMMTQLLGLRLMESALARVVSMLARRMKADEDAVIVFQCRD